MRCGAGLWLHAQAGNEPGWGPVPGRATQVLKQKPPLASGPSAFSGSQLLSGAEVRGGRKEMRLVIGLLPMAQDRPRVPRDTIGKMAAEEGRFVVVVCMDGLPLGR